MSKRVSVFISLLFPFLVFGQTGCNCSPKKSLSEQHRSKAKHLTDYSSFPIHQDTIDVSYIYQWENEFKNKTKYILEGQFSKRVLNSPEDTLYIIQGYLWFVESKKNDCDYHIEFGSADSSSQRILIEVTEENSDLQQKIKNEMDSLNKISENNSFEMSRHFKTGIKCLIVGLGFYDVSHSTDGKHGDAHVNKTAWEIHPVKEIIFE